MDTDSRIPATDAWPNALALAADLLDERGFSANFLEHPETGALSVDRALQVALGYVWKTLDGSDDDQPSRVFVAPDKATGKLYDKMSRALADHLAEGFEGKLPSVGWWNTKVTEPEQASLALRIAAARFEADRARVARHRQRR